jgi:hypothetical protein
MVTSSGTRSSSMSWRMKSKSGWLAEGKPTSISLNPICTTVSNMRRLRAGSIGSMRAWLPSRRSTEHQRGAFSIRRSGQVRSGRSSGRNGRYLSKGMRFGVTGSGGIAGPLGWALLGGRDGCRGNKKPPAIGRRSSGRTPMVALAYISRRRLDGVVMPRNPPPAADGTSREK